MKEKEYNKRTRTSGGRILRLAYRVELHGGKWVVTSGGGQPGTMTVYEAQKEARRRNKERE